MVVGLDATAFSAPTLSPGMFALFLTVFPRCTYRKHLTFSPGVGRSLFEIVSPGLNGNMGGGSHVLGKRFTSGESIPGIAKN